MAQGKEPTYEAGDAGSIPGLGRPQEKGMAIHSLTQFPLSPGGFPDFAVRCFHVVCRETRYTLKTL